MSPEIDEGVHVTCDRSMCFKLPEIDQGVMLPEIDQFAVFMLPEINQGGVYVT